MAQSNKINARSTFSRQATVSAPKRPVGVWHYVGLVVLSIAAAVSLFYIRAEYVLAVIFLVINLLFIVKYPMWGLLSYLIIFMLRPAEMIPALAPLRTELLTGGFVLVVSIIHQKYKTGKFSLPIDRITVAMSVFLFVIMISMVTSYEKTETWNTAVDFIKLMVFYYLIVAIIDTEKKFVAFVVTFLLLISYIGFDAFRLYLAGEFVHTMDVDRLTGGTSAGGDANSLANTLASTLPFIVASAMYFRKLWAKIPLYGLTLFLVVLIALTGSRAGIIAFGAVIFGSILFSRNKVVVIVVVTILLLAGWAVLPDQYKNRYMTLTDTDDLNEVSSGRWDIWKNGIRMFINRPILGVGAGAFKWANKSGDFGRGKFIAPHNIYIQLLSTTGIIGFAAWFWFIYLFTGQLRRFMAGLKDHDELRWMQLFSSSFMISLIALFISGLFVHSLYRYTWYMMAALTAAMSNIQIRQQLAAAGDTDIVEHDNENTQKYA